MPKVVQKKREVRTTPQTSTRRTSKQRTNFFNRLDALINMPKKVQGPYLYQHGGKMFLSVPAQNSQTASQTTETQQQTNHYTPEQYLKLVAEGKIPMSPKHQLIEDMVKEGKSEGATIVIMTFAKNANK